MAEDQPGAHGTADDRITAFMKGYLDGIPACNLPIRGATGPASAQTSNGSEASSLAASALLPGTLALSDDGCFHVLSDGTYPLSTVAAWLEQAGATATDIEAWGWQDGAYRTYVCSTPPPDGAGQLDIVIHRFGDAASAQAAVPYFINGYAAAPTEARRCGSAGSAMVCVTGGSPSRPPVADVQEVLQQVLAMAA